MSPELTHYVNQSRQAMVKLLPEMGAAFGYFLPTLVDGPAHYFYLTPSGVPPLQ